MVRTNEQILHHIQEVLNKYVQPNLDMHGGAVALEKFDFQTGTLTVLMSGACSGCAASKITLHQGIERTLLKYVPEVLFVEGIDDPNSSTEPYYNSFDGMEYSSLLDELNLENNSN